ncbi:unnamed protein product [Cladocopium goreaui]|uniref:Uncharacterized protein n=1 Tax=Cladocopium goreaui TaxID=2562237 RepID=A0A9P1FGT1_9DINO|nr:unnamed protein product [Cladocopium goreaui]
MGTSLQESLYLAVKEQCFLQIVPETKLVTKRYSRARGNRQPPRHCMARLLQKVLKAVVSRAGNELPPIFQVAAKSNRADEAVHFRDAFQCFLDNYFVNEDAASAAAEKPAGSTPRRPASGDRVNRQIPTA